MKNLIAPLIFILFTLLSTKSFAAIDSELNEFIEIVVKLNLKDGVDYGSKGAEVGKSICKAGGGSSCYSVNNIGQGICAAGGGSSCYSVNNIGQGICAAGDGSSCYSVNNIGQGICAAGDGASCYSVNNIGQGICAAGDGSSCYSVNNVGQGICKARHGSSCYSMTLDRAIALPVIDTGWKWDKFREPNSYNNIWACRGTATGKFADNDNCSGESKTDDTWPNN